MNWCAIGFDADAVHLYRDDPTSTDRWLVDRRGRVLGTEHLHEFERPAPARSE
jgi:hypothetical protein